MSGESHSGLGFHVLIGVEALKLRAFTRKRVQLPYSHLLSVQNRVATKVANQISQPYMECGALDSD